MKEYNYFSESSVEGASSTMLQIYQLEQAIQERMRTQSVPGLALAIVQDQQVVYARGFGMTSVEDGGVAVTPQTLFRIGSTSKPLTGTAIMRLVETGKLDLDRPINAYVDWLRFSEPGMEQKITLRMLLSHTSGLHHSIPTDLARPVDYADQYSFETLEQYAREQLPRCPFVAPPGKIYSYSNEGPTLAGYIAEFVSGMRFPQLMQKLIFDPLQMKRTTYDIAVAMTYPVAQEHEWQDDGTVRVIHRFPESRAGTPAGPHPLSTVLDLANFAIMHLNQGHFGDTQLLSEASVQEMQRDQVSMYTPQDEAYCLTFRTEMYQGRRMLRHGGITRSTTSIFYLQPEDRFAIIMLFNGLMAAFRPQDFVHSLFDQLLSSSEPSKSSTCNFIDADTTLWPRYEGSYLGIGGGGLAEIRCEEDRLRLTLNDDKLMPLQALQQDCYMSFNLSKNEPVRVIFLPEDNGPVQYININGHSYQRFAWNASFIPNHAEWERFVGTYQGNSAPIRVTIEGGKLHLEMVEDRQTVCCIPLDPTRFTSSLGLIEFLLDGDGMATGLLRDKLFHHPRVL